MVTMAVNNALIKLAELEHKLEGLERTNKNGAAAQLDGLKTDIEELRKLLADAGQLSDEGSNLVCAIPASLKPLGFNIRNGATPKVTPLDALRSAFGFTDSIYKMIENAKRDHDPDGAFLHLVKTLDRAFRVLDNVGGVAVLRSGAHEATRRDAQDFDLELGGFIESLCYAVPDLELEMLAALPSAGARKEIIKAMAVCEARFASFLCEAGVTDSDSKSKDLAKQGILLANGNASEMLEIRAARLLNEKAQRGEGYTLEGRAEYFACVIEILESLEATGHALDAATYDLMAHAAFERAMLVASGAKELYEEAAKYVEAAISAPGGAKQDDREHFLALLKENIALAPLMEKLKSAPGERERVMLKIEAATDPALHGMEALRTLVGPLFGFSKEEIEKIVALTGYEVLIETLNWYHNDRLFTAKHRGVLLDTCVALRRLWPEARLHDIFCAMTNARDCLDNPATMSAATSLLEDVKKLFAENAPLEPVFKTTYGLVHEGSDKPAYDVSAARQLIADLVSFAAKADSYSSEVLETLEPLIKSEMPRAMLAEFFKIASLKTNTMLELKGLVAEYVGLHDKVYMSHDTAMRVFKAAHLA